MRHTRSVYLLAPIAMLVGAFSGCASESAPEATATAGLPFATYSEREPGVGDSALLVGVVDSSSECVTVRESDTGVTYTPIFPSTDERARSIAGGDEVELRGGAHDDLPDGATLPKGCSPTGPFWLVVSDA